MAEHTGPPEADVELEDLTSSWFMSKLKMIFGLLTPESTWVLNEVYSRMHPCAGFLDWKWELFRSQLTSERFFAFSEGCRCAFEQLC